MRGRSAAEEDGAMNKQEELAHLHAASGDPKQRMIDYWGWRAEKAEAEVERLRAIEDAARALLADVHRRYPGQRLRCPYMITLAAAAGRAIRGAESEGGMSNPDVDIYDRALMKALAASNDQMRAEIDRLLAVCKDKTVLLNDAYGQIDRLRAALAHIGKMSAPGTRTLDDFIRDMTWINDETRRVQSRGKKDNADPGEAAEGK